MNFVTCAVVTFREHELLYEYIWNSRSIKLD